MGPGDDDDVFRDHPRFWLHPGPGEALLCPPLQRSKAGLGLREAVRPGARETRNPARFYPPWMGALSVGDCNPQGTLGDDSRQCWWLH